MKIKIKTDIGCRVYIDDEYKGIAESKALFVIDVDKGQYWGRFESFYDSDIYIERCISVIDYDVLESVDFLPIIDSDKLVLKAKKGDNGLVGFVELFSGRFIIAPQFEAEGNLFYFYYIFQDGVSRIIKNDRYGLINKVGNEILDCIYENIGILGNGWFIIENNSRFGLFHPAMNNNTISFEWTYWERFHKWSADERGWVDSGGDLIVLRNEDTYAVFSCITNKIVYQSNCNGYPHGFIRSDGFLSIRSGETEDLFSAIWGETEGLFSAKWETIVPPKAYSEIKEFFSGIAVVSKGESSDRRFGLINEKGEEVLPCIYHSIDSLSDGLLMVETVKDYRHYYGYVNRYGEVLIPCAYHGGTQFSEGLAFVEDDEYNLFIINKQGKTVKSFGKGFRHAVSDFGLFINGLARFKGNGSSTHGFIDRDGRIIADSTTYEDCSEIERDDQKQMISGCRLVRRNGYFGFINSAGREIIPPIYQMIADEGDYVAVKKNDKWGVLSHQGRAIIDCRYDNLLSATREDEYARVIQVVNENKIALFSYSGEQLTPFKYDCIGDFVDGRTVVFIDSYIGVIDQSGKEIITCNLYKERDSRFDNSGVSVYFNGEPGFLLLSNLQFYPSPVEFNTGYFDKKRQLLIMYHDSDYYAEGPKAILYVDLFSKMPILPTLHYFDEQFYCTVERKNNLSFASS